MIRNLLTLTIVLGGCATHAGSSLPAPDVLSLCFTIQTLDSAPRLLLPRALNLGTARHGDVQLQVGTLIPDTTRLVALWHIIPPDSLVIDFVPRTLVGLMSGIRLHIRWSDSLVTGKEVYWSDDIGPEISTTVMGRVVRCPAGA